MATTFTLDKIREAAEAKYGSVDIEISEGKTLSLVNPLRLPQKRREALMALQEEMEAEGADQEVLMHKALHLAAADHVKTSGKSKLAQALIDAVDGDLAVIAEVFTSYVKGAQVGEASASDD